MDNQTNKIINEIPYSPESLLNNHLNYHSQNNLKQIGFDCAQRCLNFDHSSMSTKEENCVKNCALTYYENFFSSELN